MSYAKAAALVWLVLCAPAFASEQSNPPIVSGGVLKTNAQQQSGTNQDEAKGSQSSSLTQTAVIDSGTASNPATNSTKNDTDSSASDEWGIGPISMQGAFTVVLALVAIVQMGMFWRQLGIMRAQTDIAENQTKLARDEFNATHRPHIRVLMLFEDVTPSNLSETEFTYVNAGESPANVIEIRGKVLFSKDLKPGVPIHSEVFSPPKVLAPGEHAKYSFESNTTDHLSALFGHSAERVICLGCVRYTNDAGNIMETGFCRTWDVVRGCWNRSDNSEYEYAY